MNTTWNKAAWALLASPLLLASCDKHDKGSLEGPVPTAAFTSTVNSAQYPVTVTFTDNSQNTFVNQWEFGDGTTGQGSPITHTYNVPGTYKVRLVESGRGGTASTPQTDVVVPSGCGNSGFSALVNCQGNAPSARVWTYATTAGAIKRLDASNNVISASAANALTSCQADDQFTFSGNAFTYTYESNGGTFANGTCGDSQSGSAGFVYKPTAGTLGQLILQKAGAFIGEAVVVNSLTYDIIEASSTILRLRGTLANGTKTEVTLVPFDAVTRVKQLLTNGTQKTWLLDGTAAITVGTEAAPGADYAGGPLETCQADDEYSFSFSNVFNYDAKAETFVAGPYTCQAPRTGSSPYTIEPASGAGLAQFTLTTPGRFIGATDVATATRTYRITAITDQTMTLRAPGATTTQVFTIKLRVKN